MLALLPAEVQQQVQQQGPGVLDGALVSQLQQVAAQLAPAPPAQPQPQRGAGLAGLFGGAAPQPPRPAAMPAPALQPQAPFQQQQQQRVQPPELPPSVTTQPASVFLQQLQQQLQQPHAQEQQQQPMDAAPAAVPLLRSEPVAAPKPEPSATAAALAAAPDSSNKAHLLVALAKSVGVSTEDLARALMGRAPDNAAGQPSPSTEGVPRPGSSPMPGSDSLAQQRLLLQRQASDSMAPPISSAPAGNPADGGLLPLSAALDSSGAGSSLGGATSMQAHAQPPAQPPAFGSVFQAPANSPAAPGAEAAAPAAPSRQPLDLEQLQSAVKSSGLSPGVATDASLLLQLVAAVEASQRQAGPGKDRMHSLSLKLFNVRRLRAGPHWRLELMPAGRAVRLPRPA